MKTASYRRTLLASAVAVGMTGVAQNAAAVTIDLFGSPDFSQTAEPDFFDVVNGATNAPGIIGGWRYISGVCSSANCNADPNQGLVTDAVTARILAGVYSHSQDDAFAGSTRVVWGGSTGNGFSVTDFTDGLTQNAIRVLIERSDILPAGNTVGICLTDLGGTTACRSVEIASAAPFPRYVDFLYSGFSGVNPEQVVKVQLDVQGTTGNAWDLAIDSLITACSGNTTPGGPSGPSGGPPNNGVCEPPPVEPPEVQHPKTVPAMTPLGLLGLGAGLVGIAGFFARRRKK